MRHSDVDNERERELVSDNAMLIILIVHRLHMQYEKIYFASISCVR
jgi:hypothetical protein